MELLWFTATGIILYVTADWVLRWAEEQAGRRFEQRSVVFFCILLGLALVAFTALRRFLGGA